MLPKVRKAPRMNVRERPAVNLRAAEQWIRRLECVAAKSGECSGPIMACHYRTAANSGTGQKPPPWFLWPGCFHHHVTEQHQIGQPRFEAKHGLSLRAICEGLARQNPHIPPECKP